MNAKRAGIALAIALMFAAASPASRAEVIGKTKTPLDGRQARKAECTLGDLAADAARAAVKADLALVQAGQLRAVVIPAGDLDDAQLASALVYPDEKVVLVEISGKKLRAALERGLSSLPQPGIGFLQVSGLQVKFRSQSQANHRIEAVTVGNKPLDPQHTYRAAVPASLAKGALGYFRIFNGLQVKQTGPELQQAVRDYVSAQGELDLRAGKRLVDLSRAKGR